MSFAIIGAGVAGLSVARELVLAGEQVVVVDGGPVGGGVSGAATAYLEPRLGDTPIKLLEREALARWTGYAQALEQDGGSIGFRTDGQMRVALPAQVQAFEADVQKREALGWAVERLAAEAVRRRVPWLSPDIAAAAFLEEVRSVDGRLVCRALARQVRQSGGLIHENWPVSALSEADGRLVLEGADGTRLLADTVLVATGHAPARLAGLPDDVPVTRPVRGVNLIYDQHDLPLDIFVKHHRGYLCPRGDHVLVGTTYENGVSDPVPDEAAIERLLANGETIVPDLRKRRLQGVRGGIRAKVGDGLPSFGQSAELAGLFWSLGHAGAGYLRAPVFAPELAAFLRGGTVGPWMARTGLL